MCPCGRCSFAHVVASGPRSREARRVGASEICTVAEEEVTCCESQRTTLEDELGSKCYCDGGLSLLVCLYASPCVSLQVLDLERRELLSMDATDQSPVLLFLFALRPSLCCVQKAIL